ncbi:MAG: T9SS type A sorting domain-containing protein, partial [Bacteroidetes bacterium]|nr:T9SS type A sorting domain-containing protein [Bacteroidota bacterium]
AHISGTDTFGVIPADSFLVAGIKQPVPAGVVKVFPNPFSSSLNLTIEQIRFLPATFTLRDLSGRVVYRTFVQEIENEIHIPHLPDGIYLAELTTREGKIWREKLVRYDDL